MSSTAMGIAGSNITIDLNLSTPQSLNTWLQLNNGYDGSNDLIETAVPDIDPDRIFWLDDAFHKTNDISFDEVRNFLASKLLI